MVNLKYCANGILRGFLALIMPPTSAVRNKSCASRVPFSESLRTATSILYQQIWVANKTGSCACIGDLVYQSRDSDCAPENFWFGGSLGSVIFWIGLCILIGIALWCILWYCPSLRCELCCERGLDLCC